MELNYFVGKFSNMKQEYAFFDSLQTTNFWLIGKEKVGKN